LVVEKDFAWHFYGDLLRPSKMKDYATQWYTFDAIGLQHNSTGCENWRPKEGLEQDEEGYRCIFLDTKSNPPVGKEKYRIPFPRISRASSWTIRCLSQWSSAYARGCPHYPPGGHNLCHASDKIRCAPPAGKE